MIKRDTCTQTNTSYRYKCRLAHKDAFGCEPGHEANHEDAHAAADECEHTYQGDLILNIGPNDDTGDDNGDEDDAIDGEHWPGGM